MTTSEVETPAVLIDLDVLDAAGREGGADTAQLETFERVGGERRAAGGSVLTRVDAGREQQHGRKESEGKRPFHDGRIILAARC